MKKAIPPSARTAEGGILSIKKGMYMNTLHIPEKKIPVIKRKFWLTAKMTGAQLQ